MLQTPMLQYQTSGRVGSLPNCYILFFDAIACQWLSHFGSKPMPGCPFSITVGFSYVGFALIHSCVSNLHESGRISLKSSRPEPGPKVFWRVGRFTGRNLPRSVQSPDPGVWWTHRKFKWFFKQLAPGDPCTLSGTVGVFLSTQRCV